MYSSTVSAAAGYRARVSATRKREGSGLRELTSTVPLTRQPHGSPLGGVEIGVRVADGGVRLAGGAARVAGGRVGAAGSAARARASVGRGGGCVATGRPDGPVFTPATDCCGTRARLVSGRPGTLAGRAT